MGALCVQAPHRTFDWGVADFSRVAGGLMNRPARCTRPDLARWHAAEDSERRWRKHCETICPRKCGGKIGTAGFEPATP